MDLNELEQIGLAFKCGLIAGMALEKAEDKETQEPKHMSSEERKTDSNIEKIEFKKVTPEEMAKIIKDLGEKVLGGKE